MLYSSTLRILVFILFLLFSADWCKSQLEFGIHYRLGKSDLCDQHNTGTLDSKNAYCLGIELNKRLFNFGLARIEINYDSKGAIFNIPEKEFNLTYLTIPLFFGVGLFDDRIRIMPGFYIAITNNTDILANRFPTFYNRFNKFDCGITYILEVIPIKYKCYKLKLNHTLSYGLVTAYNLELSPRITNGHTDWIRNYKFDFGLSFTIEI